MRISNQLIDAAVNGLGGMACTEAILSAKAAQGASAEDVHMRRKTTWPAWAPLLKMTRKCSPVPLSAAILAPMRRIFPANWSSASLRSATARCFLGMTRCLLRTYLPESDNVVILINFLGRYLAGDDFRYAVSYWYPCFLLYRFPARQLLLLHCWCCFWRRNAAMEVQRAHRANQEL